ncbi:MAG: uroporphyrinogen decarboxylase, partial [Alphaproteobacteria bacterium]|nr:uroporphyrinogen decarboxylase [Alphaproteobacteria bacterium]
EIASEITMQPINKFDFDAAIIFSDILVIPHALGLDLEFVKDKGPVMTKISFEEKDINRFVEKNIGNSLNSVYEAIKITRKKLPKEKELIGFAGAPWTLFSYMVEGGGSKNFDSANIALIKNKEESRRVIKKLTEAVSEHLIKQIEAGADMVQLFDSWAGEISVDKYEEFVINPACEIVKKIRDKHKNIPIICFPRKSSFRYKDYVERVKPDIVSIDQDLPLKWVKENLQGKAIIQGNLDPMILIEDKEKIKSHAKKIIEEFGEGNFIFNLGRGVSKETPVENVQYLVDVVRGMK